MFTNFNIIAAKVKYPTKKKPIKELKFEKIYYFR